MLRHWSLAIYDLHLSDEDFWALTPRQFEALMDRSQYNREHNEFMQAMAIAYGINFSMRAPKDPVMPTDFMPSRWSSPKPKRRTKRQVSVETLTAKEKWTMFASVHNARLDGR